MNIRMRVAIGAVACVATIAAGSGAAALANSGSAPSTRQASAGTSFTWHSLHLINGWRALAPQVYGRPSYAIRDGVLYLSGILDAFKSQGPEFAVLPAGARPRHFLWLSYFNFGSGAATGSMEIDVSGGMFAYDRPVDPSLQAISVPLSS